jgi:hypothetical protein
MNTIETNPPMPAVGRPVPSAFDMKVALACEVARVRCAGYRPTLWDGRIEELALSAGEAAALDGADLCSPLVQLAESGCAGVRRVYELAYWEHSPTIDATLYFSLAVDGPWVRITSKGVAGGDGEVSLHSSFVNNFFSRAADWNVSSYRDWALNPYPVGGTTTLYRYERIEHETDFDGYEDYDGDDQDRAHALNRAPDPRHGVLMIDPDTHPSKGRIAFGDPTQELTQIGALLQLRATVQRLIAANTPSAVASILQRVQLCFMPSDGYCTWCQADVTSTLIERGRQDAITGCPICAHTWCD